MKNKTFKQINEQIKENSLGTCEYVGGIARPGHKITLHCLTHDLTFETNYDAIRKSTYKHFICPECKQADRAKNKVEVECAFCGKSFMKSKSKVLDFNFCCRKCKDAAQKISSGSKFDPIRPDHYTEDGLDYRQKAFDNYPPTCAVCDWHGDLDVLEVHHIDSHHTNNKLENLIILCPICHRKLTLNKYKLVDRKKIIPSG